MANPSLLVRIGRRIRDLRKKRRLSQQQLGELIGVGQGHMGQIERGKVAAQIDTLQNICTELHVPLEKLFQGF